jgi:hypothetical protein
MAGVKKYFFCRELFKKLGNVLTLASEFLLSFVADNMEKFQTNSDIHSINTRHKCDLHMPHANPSSYQKGACYAGIKLFNTLPSNIKSLSHDIKVVKPALKDFVSSHFCSIENS